MTYKVVETSTVTDEIECSLNEWTGRGFVRQHSLRHYAGIAEAGDGVPVLHGTG